VPKKKKVRALGTGSTYTPENAAKSLEAKGGHSHKKPDDTLMQGVDTSIRDPPCVTGRMIRGSKQEQERTPVGSFSKKLGREKNQLVTQGALDESLMDPNK